MNKSVLFGLVNTASVKTLGTSSLGVLTPANTSTMTHTTTEINTANSLMIRLTWEYGGGGMDQVKLRVFTQSMMFA